MKKHEAALWVSEYRVLQFKIQWSGKPSRKKLYLSKYLEELSV